MKVGLIGTGYWGRNHARVWRELKDEGIIDDVILCDIREEAVKPLARDLDLNYETNPKRIIENESIDSVDIASSTPTHYPLAKNAMINEKHVLVEKPMAENSKECEDLINIANKKNKILMVGHIFRYHPALIELTKMVSRGELGEIVLMDTRRLSLRYPRSDMGVLFALAIHDVDISTFILNEDPSEIFGVVSSNYISGIEEDAHIYMKFKKATSHIYVSWNYPSTGKIRELVVVGTEATAKIDYLKPDEIVVYDAAITSDGIRNEGYNVKRIQYREPLKEELMDFVKCVDRGEIPKANMYVGKKAVEILEKVFESVREKRVIKIK